MKEGTYNGWKNRSTWNAHLWLTNDYDVYHAAEAAAKRGDVEGLVTLTRDYTGAIGDGCNLPEVDWREIVNALTEE